MVTVQIGFVMVGLLTCFGHAAAAPVLHEMESLYLLLRIRRVACK